MSVGAHFSKKNIHGSCSIHGSHLEKVKCETRISLHGFLLIKFREKCEMRVYIFRWSIWEVRNVKFCVRRELNFWKNGLQIAAERHIPPNLKGYSWTLARTAREEEEEGAAKVGQVYRGGGGI